MKYTSQHIGKYTSSEANMRHILYFGLYNVWTAGKYTSILTEWGTCNLNL